MNHRTLQIAIAGLALMAMLVGCGSSTPPPPPREQDKALSRAVQEPLDKARAAKEASEAAAKRTEDALKQE